MDVMIKLGDQEINVEDVIWLLKELTNNMNIKKIVLKEDRRNNFTAELYDHNGKVDKIKHPPNIKIKSSLGYYLPSKQLLVQSIGGRIIITKEIPNNKPMRPLFKKERDWYENKT